MSQGYGSHFIYGCEGRKVSLMWDNWPVLKAGREKSCRYLGPEQREKSMQRLESGGGQRIAREEEGSVGHVGFHGSMSEWWTLLRVWGKPVESTCRAEEGCYRYVTYIFKGITVAAAMNTDSREPVEETDQYGGNYNETSEAYWCLRLLW